MIKRVVRKNIDRSIQNFPITGLIGSRQVGKSTLAKLVVLDRANSLYLDLEKDSDNRKLSEAELYLNQFKDRLIIIDEVQRKPEIFPLLRSLVDEWGGNGHFLLLGSASPSLIRQASESLAGRIEYIELSPFLLTEVNNEKSALYQLWLRGGYPRSFLAQSDEDSMRWRTAFARTFLERDIPQLGLRIPSITLNRFWQMIAHLHGQMWNASKIAQSLSISPPSSRHYLDILDETFIIRQISPFFANIKKRLVKSPKIYFRDSGILHYLLGISTLDTLLGHPSVGMSWEGFIIEQIINYYPERTRDFYFYRTSSGSEIDLIYAPASKTPVAIEIKLSNAPVISKGFHEAFRDIGCEKGFFIYSGNESYPLAKNITAIPATMMNKIFE